MIYAPFTLINDIVSVLVSAISMGATTTTTTLGTASLSLLGQHIGVVHVLGGMLLSALTSYGIHAVADKKDASSWVRAVATPIAGLHALLHFCLMTVQITNYSGSVLIKLGLILLLLVLGLKQWSFVATSAEFRQAHHNALTDGGQLSSPPSSSSSGVTFQSFLYFLAAPTLIYQNEYSRMERTNWTRVLYLATQQYVILAFASVVAQKWMWPLLVLHETAVATQTIPKVVLGTLQMSVPCTLVWLATVAYGLFYVHLNLVAEITRFGDRHFFGDWWNCRTLKQYWSTWNLPISTFLRRHVLQPLKRAGSPGLLSFVLVFVVSGLLHEVAVAVALGTYRGYRSFLWVEGAFAFYGMMGQLPAIALTKPFAKLPQWVGNLVFWAIFCVVGQPLAVLLYHHEVTGGLPGLAASAAGMA